MLQRLVYYSRNAMPEGGPDQAREIEQILDVSRRNNERDGVTGALMFNRGCFAQILEGPQAAVERCFERIQRDPRHSEVLLVDLVPIEYRAFGSWAMAFLGTSPEGAAAFDRIAKLSRFDPKRLTGERLFELLRELVLDAEFERIAA